MKKFLAFLLALTMVFAMTASVLAEGETYLWGMNTTSVPLTGWATGAKP